MGRKAKEIGDAWEKGIYSPKKRENGPNKSKLGLKFLKSLSQARNYAHEF